MLGEDSVEKSSAEKSSSCKNCGERIFVGERCYVGQYYGKRSIRSAVYCRFCFEDGSASSHLENLGTPVAPPENQAEMDKETFAHNRVAGVRHLYLPDMD